jgi:hypothetical protein
MVDRPVATLVRRSGAWLSAAVLACVVLAEAVQSLRPTALGFMHRDYDAAQRCLRQVVVSAHDGGVWFDWAYHSVASPPWHDRWTRLMADRPRWWQRFDWPGGYSADGATFGIYADLGSNAARQRYLIVRVPYWFIATTSALLPAVALVRWLRARRRRQAGQCCRCGYDLRGSSQRCPECGTIIDAMAAGGPEGWR